MVDWIKGFIIPTIELLLIGGIVLYLGFLIVRAYLKVWHNSLKWFFRYTILRGKYEERDVLWILQAIEKDIPKIKAKQMLLLNGVSLDKTNELMWIYDKIFKQLQGGKSKDGQRIAGSDKQAESITSFPDIKTY